MGVYKKDNRWYIDYYLPDGKRKRETVTIEGVEASKITRQDARKALDIRKGQIAGGKFDIAQTRQPVLFEKFIDRYMEYSKANKKSWERDETSCKWLLRYFRGKALGQITPWLIERYKSLRQKDLTCHGRIPAKATINREVACLKNMFTKANEWGLVTSNPVKKVKLFPEKQSKLRVLSQEEFNKLFNASSDLLKPVLIIAGNTGMRQGEILNLKWDDVNFKHGYITVRESKNNETRMIPMNPVLVDTLIALKRKSIDEYLFSYAEGKAIKSIKKGSWGALKRAGIPHCRFHDLRHTFATNLVMNGIDIVTVQELLGHKSIAMTKRYSHPTPEHKKHAVESLNIGGMDTYLDTKSSLEVVKSDVSP